MAGVRSFDTKRGEHLVESGKGSARRAVARFSPAHLIGLNTSRDARRRRLRRDSAAVVAERRRHNRETLLVHVLRSKGPLVRCVT
jgi:hypothetical protein